VQLFLVHFVVFAAQTTLFISAELEPAVDLTAKTEEKNIGLGGGHLQILNKVWTLDICLDY